MWEMSWNVTSKIRSHGMVSLNLAALADAQLSHARTPEPDTEITTVSAFELLSKAHLLHSRG